MYEWVLAILITASTHAPTPNSERGVYHAEVTSHVFPTYTACANHIRKRDRRVGAATIVDRDILICVQTTKPRRLVNG